MATPTDPPATHTTAGTIARTSVSTDAVQLLDDVPLTEAETEYVEAARAANTLRGYRSDWTEFTTWCTQHGRDPLPAAASTITGYLSDLAKAGAKTWKTKGRPPEPDLAGHRDEALLLVGFGGALHRSELAALLVEHVDEHPNGLVLSLPRSKTN